MESRAGSPKLPQIMFSGLKSQQRRDVPVDPLSRGLSFPSELPGIRKTICLEPWDVSITTNPIWLGSPKGEFSR